MALVESTLLTVEVDAVPWRWVSNLSAAGANDRVFAVEPESGVVVFGDGTHGQRPPAGAAISVRYRNGSGAAGNLAVDVSAREAHLKPLERVLYFPGALLTAEDFQAEQEYFLGRKRRHNLALHGSGIVFGLEVTASRDGITVSPGMAIDASGNEIVVSTPELLHFPTGCKAASLVITYAEVMTRPVPHANAEPNSAETRHSRVKEGFAFEYSSASAAGGEPKVSLARLSSTAGRWRARSAKRFRTPG